MQWFCYKSYGESWDSSWEKSWVPVHKDWVPEKRQNNNNESEIENAWASK